ncbi:MAG: putative sulfate exporter family transporter, partial [Brachybacterium sp.]|nr:putative sulfate exporter family transporter [Brachybacterium sp.]
MRSRQLPPSPAPARSRTGVLPGLLFSAGIGAVALLLASAASWLSPLLLAIIAGVLLANTEALSTRLDAGLAVAAKPVLRIGIVLLGLQLVLGDVLALGPGVLVLIVAVVLGGFAAGILGGRLLGLPREETLLISGGTAICGAAAIGAIRDTLRPSPDDRGDRLEVATALSLALIVVLGTIMIPVVPLL